MMKKIAGLLMLLLTVGMLCSCSNAGTAITNSTDDFAMAMNEKRDYLTVVNKNHPYIFGGDYDKALQDDLIYVSDCDSIPTPVEKAAYLAFSELVADLHKQGIDIALYSAYRTKDDQQWVYDNYANLEGWGDVYTVAQPGYSEHHTGIMIEYVVWYNGGDQDAPWEWYTVTPERAGDSYYRPIWDTIAKYGFILRYPEGKEQVTGVSYLPYELRFVGSSEIASEIMSNEICLEEYTSKY